MERPSDRQTSHSIFSTVQVAALAALLTFFFTLYLFSSFSLESRAATIYFGADTWHYTAVASGEINDRIWRLHPISVALALGWMKLLAPLTGFIAPATILKSLFALTGAIGVIAAVFAFTPLVSRMQALLWATVYGSSTTIWYFSSIEESKIVSATLVAIYIAFYVNFRTRWTRNRIALLSAVLLLACLNEITAIFLVAIPVIETFLKHRFATPQWRWVLVHLLVFPFALAILETIRRIAPAIETEDGRNFFELFFYYVSRNSYNLQVAWDFLQRWFLFNIAAPEAEINFAVAKIKYGGDFEPSILKYFDSWLAIALVVCLTVLASASLWFRIQTGNLAVLRTLLIGIAAYAVARMLFFFVFLPGECLLYSPSVSLAHLILLAIPFAASKFHYKVAALLIFAVLLFANNALFIFTAQTVPLPGQ